MKTLSTKKSRRVTRQVRIGSLIHSAIRTISREASLPISRLLDLYLKQIPDVRVVIKPVSYTHLHPLFLLDFFPFKLDTTLL